MSSLLRNGIRYLRSNEFRVLFLTCLAPILALLIPWQRIGAFSLFKAWIYLGVLSFLGTGTFLLFKSINFKLALAFIGISSLVCFSMSALGFQLWFTYGPLNASTLSTFLYVLLDSNIQEIYEYIHLTFKWWFFALLLAGFITVYVIVDLIRFSQRKTSRKGCLSAALICIAVGVLPQFHDSLSFKEPAILIRDTLKMYRDDMALIKLQMAGSDSAAIPISRPVELENVQETFVLVLGESTTRENMQLYGYDRKTTPQLYAKKNDLYVFRDVISPHSHTIQVLKKLFTFADHENPNAWKTSPDILTLFREAGFKVTWISNQPVLGAADSWVTAFASRADVRLFLNLNASRSYDDVVIDPFLQVIQQKDRKKLIVVHLIGTHTDARFRYPQSFSFFNQNIPLASRYSHVKEEIVKQGIDHYDNAVLFNDHIVSQLIELVKRVAGIDSRAAIIYMSDHGEEVFHINSDYIGHSESFASRYMFEIPLLAWFNQKLSSELTVPKRMLETRPFQTDSWIHSLLDLAKIDVSGLDRSRSLFSNSFKPRKRFINLTDYDAWRKSSAKLGRLPMPAAGKRVFSSNVWVHRTNSIEKLRLLKDKYQGFELDIVFDASKDRFEVAHASAPSQNGLGLEEYFNSLANPQSKYFWLDFKNLNENNSKQALKCLEDLAERHRIRPNLIVESQRPVFLTMFTDRGFYTSYYLPSRSNYIFYDDWFRAIRGALRNSRVNAISTTDDDYQNLKDQLMDYDVLLWHPIDLEKIRQDKRVKVVLVKENTPFER